MGQFILYGPSLVGRKILLPLDYLAGPPVYLPQTPEVEKIEVQDIRKSDPVLACEPQRRFAVAELHAGRLPMWAPYHFAGAPFLWPKFSPFLLLECFTESPVILAWAQLVAALVAGVGAYLFCTRVLGVSFWPATVATWCFPVTGFQVLWQEFSAISPVVGWLPWILLAVDKTVRGVRTAESGVRSAERRMSEELHGVDGLSRLNGRTTPERAGGSPGGWGGRFAPVGLAAATALVLVSGQLDVAGQVLLVSGLFGAWCLVDEFGGKRIDMRPRTPLVSAAMLKLAAAWALGFLLAAPAILPVLEYSRTGERILWRSQGGEERPPVGWKALPQTVLPDMYGAMARGNVRFDDGNQNESSAATYAGVVATLMVAPLAWCSRRHRSLSAFWVLLAVFGLSWSLNLPGFVQLLRLPGLNMMSHNRLVFASAFAILALAAIGFEALLQGPLRWRQWFWLPVGVLAALTVWCVYRTLVLPEVMEVGLPMAIQQGRQMEWVRDLDGVQRAQDAFALRYAMSGALCGAGVLGWLLVRSGWLWRFRLLPALGALLVGDLLWFGYGRNPQCDPALYYPRIPVLEEVARAAPGRVIGFQCLPPILSAMCGLRDVRGYDAVDPARMVELVRAAMAPRTNNLAYATLQWMAPETTFTPGGSVQLSPILDMLGVRYVIWRGSPPPEVEPPFKGFDYWALVNSNALPRTYVPRRVEVVGDDKVRLAKLASPQFNPREVAFVEAPVELPPACRGAAEVKDESPTRITVSVRMQTPGLVVLADQWNKGWRAYLNGKGQPILRANHAVRGVVVPAGEGKLEFRYEPATFTWGLTLTSSAAAVLLGWLAVLSRRRNEEART